MKQFVTYHKSYERDRRVVTKVSSELAMTKRKFSESAIDQEDGSERRLRSGRTTSFVTTSPVTNAKSTGSPSRVSPRKRIQPLKPDVAQKDDVDSECSLKSLKRKEIKTQKVSKNRSDAVKDPVEEASQLYGDYGAGKESSSTSFFFGFKLLKTRS